MFSHTGGLILCVRISFQGMDKPVFFCSNKNDFLDKLRWTKKKKQKNPKLHKRFLYMYNQQKKALAVCLTFVWLQKNT